MTEASSICLPAQALCEPQEADHEKVKGGDSGSAIHAKPLQLATARQRKGRQLRHAWHICWLVKKGTQDTDSCSVRLTDLRL